MKYVTIAVVVLVILGAAGFYFYSQNQPTSDSMMKKDEVVMEKKEESMEKTNTTVDSSDSAMKKTDDKMMAEGGQYVPFTQAAYDGASGKKRVLYFYANWCPTCKPIDIELTANTAKIPADIAIFRVNYNDTDTDAADKALAQEYGITYQHTFVQVDDQGNEIAKWNGGGLDKIVSSVK